MHVGCGAATPTTTTATTTKHAAHTHISSLLLPLLSPSVAAPSDNISPFPPQVAVHFLTPCHATPMHSYLHLRQSTGAFDLFGVGSTAGTAAGANGNGGVQQQQQQGQPLCVDLQYLDCSPDLDAAVATRAATESERFLAGPRDFAARRYDGSADPDLRGFSAHFRTHALPQYFVLFSAQLPQLGSFLAVSFSVVVLCL